jgi:hypothetical protein
VVVDADIGESQERCLVHGIRARGGEIAAQCRIALAECAAPVAGVQRQLRERASADVVGEPLQQRSGLIATAAAKTVVDLETCLDDFRVGFEAAVLGVRVGVEVVGLVGLIVAKAPASGGCAARGVAGRLSRRNLGLGLDFRLRGREFGLWRRRYRLDSLVRCVSLGFSRSGGITGDDGKIGEIAEVEAVLRFDE